MTAFEKIGKTSSLKQKSGKKRKLSDRKDYKNTAPKITAGGPRGVMVKAMDYGIVVSEFVFQSRYYVHFRTNTLRKGMNPLILPAMG